MSRTFPSLIFFVGIALLCGCSAFAPQTANVEPNGCGAPDNATGLRLELVGQQMAAGQYHAALAHLDTIDEKLPQAQLMRARALRAIHDPKASEARYRALLNSCLAAYAHQGLGIIAADRRDLMEALAQLHTARKLAPIDADIRNDYGFVLLAAGRIDESLRELRTAVELASGNSIAARNLVLALFVARRDNEARATAQSYAFAETDIEALATRARNYKPLVSRSRHDKPAGVMPAAQQSAGNQPVAAPVARTNIVVQPRQAVDANAGLIAIPVNPVSAGALQEVSKNETH